jgi:glucokinase
MLCLGLDVGGTKSAAVVGDERGNIWDRVEWPSAAHRGPAPMIDELCHNAAALRARHEEIAAVGVSIGGPIDVAAGFIYSPPHLPGWDCIPLRDILQKRLGLAVRVEHDAAACAWAEYLWGAGRGGSRVIYLTCGTGLGIGMVFDGQIYRGAHGLNCEIGHARYRDDGPVAHGKSGSIEAFCAASSLGWLAAWRFPERWPKAPPSAEIAALAQSGDSLAREVIAINVRAVGDLCAWLGDFLRPDVIILGSLARYLGTEWVEAVRQRFVAETFAATSRHCRLAAPGLGERLQDCSALAVAISIPGTRTDIDNLEKIL